MEKSSETTEPAPSMPMPIEIRAPVPVCRQPSSAEARPAWRAYGSQGQRSRVRICQADAGKKEKEQHHDRLQAENVTAHAGKEYESNQNLDD